jgi:3-oxoacyl-[acyl-carrier protein] reductase
MELGLSGRRAAVAASSRGLGFACAAALAAEGARVAVCGRSEPGVAAAAARLGPDAVPLVADVGSAAGAREFVAGATNALGGLDILVTNAGGPPAGTFATTPYDSYPEALELNLLSVVAMCQAVVPGMQAQGFGRVVAVTSISVRQPIPHLILSNTARAGVTGFLKTLAREVAGDGVTVNSVQPGAHATERLLAVYGDAVDEQVKKIPVRKFGRPEDFGRLVAFLCSDHAAFITGASIPVDGGEYAGLL